MPTQTTTTAAAATSSDSYSNPIRNVVLGVIFAGAVFGIALVGPTMKKILNEIVFPFNLIAIIVMTMACAVLPEAFVWAVQKMEGQGKLGSEAERPLASKLMWVAWYTSLTNILMTLMFHMGVEELATLAKFWSKFIYLVIAIAVLPTMGLMLLRRSPDMQELFKLRDTEAKNQRLVVAGMELDENDPDVKKAQDELRTAAKARAIRLIRERAAAMEAA